MQLSHFSITVFSPLQHQSCCPIRCFAVPWGHALPPRNRTGRWWTVFALSPLNRVGRRRTVLRITDWNSSRVFTRSSTLRQLECYRYFKPITGSITQSLNEEELLLRCCYEPSARNYLLASHCSRENMPAPYRYFPTNQLQV